MLGRFAIKAFLMKGVLHWVKSAEVTKRDRLDGFEQQPDLNYAQQNFLSVLETAVGSAYEVRGRVRALDILRADQQGFKSKTLARAYQNYFFDFVICRRSDQAIVCVVELSQSRYFSKGRQRQVRALEALLEDYCQRVKLPRLVVAQQRGYQLPELIERFESLLVQSSELKVQSG